MRIINDLYLNVLKYNNNDVKTKFKDNIRRTNLV